MEQFEELPGWIRMVTVRRLRERAVAEQWRVREEWKRRMITVSRQAMASTHIIRALPVLIVV